MLYFLSALFLFCFLVFPERVSKSTGDALVMCAQKLIPALFPFAVLVGIINLSGAYEPISRLLGRPIAKLFGIAPSAVYAVLLGSVGGFPIGAVCVRSLYISGKIEKGDAERLLAMSSNASPAFCISAVGQAMIGNQGFGVRLYICQLCAMLVIGLFLRKGKCKMSVVPIELPNNSLSSILSSSIENAGMTMLKICSFAVFFAVIGDILCSFAKVCFGGTAACIIAVISELTLGVRYAMTFDGKAQAVFTAFAVGWSGISVYMQTSSVVSGTGLTLSIFRRAKAAQGIITAAFMYLSLQ